MPTPQPPMQIHSPRLRELKVKRVLEAESGNRVGTGFALWVESRMTGQWYKLLLRGPMLLSDNPRPADGAALRAFFSDECSLVSVFLERNTVEFSGHDGFIGAVTCKTCEVELPEAETA